MVLCVDGEGSPPQELQIAWACNRWRCAPSAGGYFDQDYFLMQRMGYFTSIYNALTKLRNSRGKEIHRLTENERMILKWLVDLGLLFNG